MRLIAFILTLAITGCTQFPELDSAVSSHAQSADYPALLPVETLLAQSTQTGINPEQTISATSNRLNALKARAARLHGPVIDTNSRVRMARGVK